MFDAGKLRSVESLDAAGRSIRVAGVGRRGDTARYLMRLS